MMFGVFSFIFPLVCVISAAKERCDFDKFDCDTRDPCSPTLCTPGVTLYEGRGANYHVQCHATEGCHTVECPATTIYDYDDNQCVSKFPDRCNAEEFNCGSNNPCAHELCVAGQSRYPNTKANRYVQCTEDGTCDTRKCPRGQIFSTIVQDCVNDVPSELGQCEVEEANRIQCEADNVNQEECELNACCWEEGTSAPTCFYSNYEVSGYITRSTGCAGLTPFSEAAVSRLECAQTCYGDSQCVRFEYHDQLENNQCKLFSDSCKVSTIAGVFSYDKVASPGYRCRRGDCPGDDLSGQQFNVDSQECRRLCDANPSCLLYLTVYLDWTSHMCYLKHTVCDPTALSTQPGQICDREHSGVQLLTANGDYTNMEEVSLIDNDDSSCIDIPEAGSEQEYVTARIPFPTLNSPENSFTVVVKGENLQCARRFTTVSMKVGVTLGNPAFDHNELCSFDYESSDGSLTLCTYTCSPSSYAEALFVSLNNNEAGATVCDIAINPASSAEPPHCEVEVTDRVQCEADDVNQGECELNGCCWEEGTSGPNCFYSNYELSGFILRSTGCTTITPYHESTVSRLACADACYIDDQCVHFEYHNQLEAIQCKLYSESCKVSSIAGAFSYDKAAAPGYRCRRGDCPGDDLSGQQFNVDSQECRRLCDANPSCLLYLTVYLDWASHMCYLKDTVCDPTLLSTQPGQICDRETNGVQVQTADDDYTDVDVGAVADASDGTCTSIPLSDSSHQYLTARLPFPTLNSADHSFIVTVVGENLQCARRFTSVSMKVGVTWGDPAFDFNDLCRADSESVDGALTTCTYFCNPSSYAEAAFVTMSSNVADATVCDISAGPVSA